jgi:hypothetical protein
MNPAGASDLRARQLLERLLAELSLSATLADFDETANGGYSFRVEMSGELGKELHLPKRLVQAGLRDRRSLAAVRQILRANLLVLATGREVRAAQAARAARPSPTSVTLGAVTDVDTTARTIVIRDAVIHVPRSARIAELTPGTMVSAAWRQVNGRKEALAVRWRRARA